MNWKRVEGTNGKLQAFGFCEYDNPQFTLRCIRLLNGYEIAEKKLLVKVDQKTRELLGEYLRKNRRDDKAPLTKNAKKAASFRNIPNKNARNNEDGEIDDEEAVDNKNINLELVDEDTLKEDRITIGALELILKQYSKDLNPPEVVPPAPEAENSTVPGAAPAAPAESTESASSPSTGVYMKPHLVFFFFKCHLKRFFLWFYILLLSIQVRFFFNIRKKQFYVKLNFFANFITKKLGKIMCWF